MVGSATHGGNLSLRRAHDRNVCGLDLGSFSGALAQTWMALRPRRRRAAPRDVCNAVEDRKSSPGFWRRFVFRPNLSLYPGLAWLRPAPALGFGLETDQREFLQHRDPAHRALVVRTLSRPSAGFLERNAIGLSRLGKVAFSGALFFHPASRRCDRAQRPALSLLRIALHSAA